MNNNILNYNSSLYDEPYVGMPIYLDRSKPTSDSSCDLVNGCPLGMAYVPWQLWRDTYEPDVALQRGTIFPELDLPFWGGGRC